VKSKFERNDRASRTLGNRTPENRIRASPNSANVLRATPDLAEVADVAVAGAETATKGSAKARNQAGAAVKPTIGEVTRKKESEILINRDADVRRLAAKPVNRVATRGRAILMPDRSTNPSRNGPQARK